jgi:hypothetical protein
VDARRERALRDFADLRRLGRVARHASGYLRFAGRADSGQRAAWRQLELFEGLGPGWRTGLARLDGKKLAPSGDQRRYEYPGQTGRRLYYGSGKPGDVVRCR